jgi:hypothetical protein
MEHGDIAKKARKGRERQQAGGSRQKSEVKYQTSEVRVKLISDLRLLTSGIDGFNALPLTAHCLPLTILKPLS